MTWAYAAMAFEHMDNFSDFLDIVNADRDKYKIIKVYSNGPNYFFVFYEVDVDK